MKKFLQYVGILLVALWGAQAPVGASSASSSQCPVLLCPYDMGDLNALKALAGALEKRDRKVCFWSVGQAWIQMKEDPRSVEGAIGKGGVEAWPRERLLSQEEMASLQALKPQVVVVGMASASQAQLLTLTPGRAYAFYDNFDPIKGKEYIQPFLDQTQRTGPPSAYWAPSQKTADSFEEDPRTKGSKIKVVGQPVLEEWDALFATTDRPSLRQELKIEEGRRVILFAGGYDDTYETHVTLFIDTLKDLVEDLNLEVLLTYHPKPGGVLEKQLVAQAGSPHIRVIDGPAQGGIATNKLATIADIFMCHKSSMGPQAISQGLPMLYVADPQEYKNFVLDAGLAHIAGTKETLAAKIRDLLENTVDVSLAPLGVPKEPASQVMAGLVEEALSN